MSIVLIPLTALLASILTFFSGFGLGTILLPVFSIYYEPPIAVALTAIVHFLNNIFKIGLVYKNIKWNVVLKFGIPSLIAALLGAFLLKNLSSQTIVLAKYYLELTEINYQITFFNLIIGLLIIFFSLFEIIPYFKNLSFSENKLTIGGFLSGFFGGLSGHQGALRSAFLVRLKLSKESFVATGTAIACLVDIARMSIYAITFDFVNVSNNAKVLIIAVLAAFIGAIIGNKLLKKTTIGFLKWFVTVFMIVIALLMIFGIIN
ncbi:MAG: sulfite exporter TauE/SafE family protein [Burkholderiales bacterium]|nr:sulfite exporter TauE/SafE family protein [Bacteroidia bacterium]